MTMREPSGTIFFNRLPVDLALVGALALPLGLYALLGQMPALPQKPLTVGILLLVLGVFNMIALALVDLKEMMDQTVTALAYRLMRLTALAGYGFFYAMTFFPQLFAGH